MKLDTKEVDLLDKFAALGLQTILGHAEVFLNNSDEAVANWAYGYARAMIEKRREIVCEET